MVIACDRGLFHDPCEPSPVCVCHLIRRALRGDNVSVIETGLVSQEGRKEYFRARLLKRKVARPVTVGDWYSRRDGLGCRRHEKNACDRTRH